MAKRHMLDEQTRRMINTIRLLSEQNDVNNDKEYVINKNTPNFGDIRATQEEDIRKTIGESIELADNALVFKIVNGANDMILSGKVTSPNIEFQFRYNDPDGEGCYIWVQELKLTDPNQRIIGKIKDAFVIWHDKIRDNSGELLTKLRTAVEQHKL